MSRLLKNMGNIFACAASRLLRRHSVDKERIAASYAAIKAAREKGDIRHFFMRPPLPNERGPVLITKQDAALLKRGNCLVFVPTSKPDLRVFMKTKRLSDLFSDARKLSRTGHTEQPVTPITVPLLVTKEQHSQMLEAALRGEVHPQDALRMRIVRDTPRPS